MAQLIYGVIRDNGDGSASMVWFQSQDIAELASDKEEYGISEGIAVELSFPDSLDLESCGFSFSDDSVDEDEDEDFDEEFDDDNGW
jgi:hypothetical protein